MKLVLAALSMAAVNGCAVVAPLVVDVAAVGLEAAIRAPGYADPEAPPLNEDELVTSLITRSRNRMWTQNDVYGAPECAVTAERTGERTWTIRTCHENWRCHLVPHTADYDCRTEQLSTAGPL